MALVVGKRPGFVVRLPVIAHRLIAAIEAEWTMVVPLISRAQVRILAEGGRRTIAGLSTRSQPT